MRRFEMVEGTSKKFWEVATEGKALTVRFGRIGTDGSTKTKAFPTAEKAEAELAKLVREKTAKGYAETGGEGVLARLESALARVRPGFVDTLGAGATSATIAKLEKAVGALPPALSALFRWRGRSDARFEGNWSLMSAADALDAHATLTELLQGGEFSEPTWWHAKWVPFLENGGGDHVCVDLAGAFGGKPGQVLEFWHADSDRPVTHPSLDAWLSVFVELLEAGAYSAKKGGYFEADETQRKKVCAKACPGYPQRHDAAEEAVSTPAKAKPAKPTKGPAIHPRALASDAAALAATKVLFPCGTSRWDVWGGGRRWAYATGGNNPNQIVCDGEEGAKYKQVGNPSFAPDGRLVHGSRSASGWTAHVGELTVDGFSHEPTVTFSGDHFAIYGRAGAGSRLVLDGTSSFDTARELDGHALASSGQVAHAVSLGDDYGGADVFLGKERVGQHKAVSIANIAISPDGKHVAYVTKAKPKNDRDRGFYELYVDGKKAPVAGIENFVAVAFGYSPKGELYWCVDQTFAIGKSREQRWLYFAYFDSKGALYATNGFEFRDAAGTELRSSAVAHHAYHEPTKRLAWCDSSTVWIAKRKVPIKGDVFDVRRLAFSDDGKQLGFAAWDISNVTWHVAKA